uniref:Ubiquitin-like domain-containing protein n=2 Tax=Oreochromis aureus TaxID=47969 RepID=A0A668TI68_OREAU
MGQKKDLTGSEKSKIVRYLAEGCSSLKIAKLLKRDHRTIKRFIQNSQQGRKKRVDKPRRKITAHELRKVKRAAAKMPLATSLAIFQSCNITGVPKSTRCAILGDMAKEGVKTENNEHINLKVAGQDGSVVQFKIKRHTPLSKLMKAYCERQGLSMRQIRFRFDGQPINETDTPSQLEMEDEDTIDVFQQQTGGSPL